MAGRHHHVAQQGARRAVGADADQLVGHRGLIEVDGAAVLGLGQRTHGERHDRLPIGCVADIGQRIRLRQAAAGLQGAPRAVHKVRHRDAAVIGTRQRNGPAHQRGCDTRSPRLGVDRIDQRLQVRNAGDDGTDHRCAGRLGPQFEAHRTRQRQLTQVQAGALCRDDGRIDRSLAPVHDLDDLAG